MGVYSYGVYSCLTGYAAETGVKQFAAKEALILPESTSITGFQETNTVDLQMW